MPQELAALLSLLILLSIMGVGLKLMGKGKPDLFWMFRPVVRSIGRLPGKIFRGMSKSCKNVAKSAWQTARHGRTSSGAKLFLYPVAAVLWIIGTFLAIPADLFSEVIKKH